MKEQLEEWLYKFKKAKFIAGCDVDVRLFSGIKPCETEWWFGHKDYKPLTFGWFVEIWVNDRCIWRNHKEGENPIQFEDELLEKTFNEIVLFGLNEAWNHQKDKVGREKEYIVTKRFFNSNGIIDAIKKSRK